MYRVVMGVAPADEQALDKAAAVADLPGDRERHVTLVHVVEEGADADAASVPAVERARDFLADRDIETDLVVATGNPTDVLLDVAEDQAADLLCVAGRRRSPAGKLQLRSGAQAVILNADVPVLVAGDVDD